MQDASEPLASSSSAQQQVAADNKKSPTHTAGATDRTPLLTDVGTIPIRKIRTTGGLDAGDDDDDGDDHGAAVPSDQRPADGDVQQKEPSSPAGANDGEDGAAAAGGAPLLTPRSRANSAQGRIARIRQHFLVDTNVQIGLEMMPPLGGKLMFYSWYVVLIVAIVLQTDLNWQYQCNDICGTRQCVLGRVNKVPTVTSTPCAKVSLIDTSSRGGDDHGGGGGLAFGLPAAATSSNDDQTFRNQITSALFEDASRSGKNNHQHSEEENDENKHQEQQPGLLNRMATFFFGGNQQTVAHTDVVNDEEAPDSMFEIDGGATEASASSSLPLFDGETASSNNDGANYLRSGIISWYCARNGSQPAAPNNVTTCGISWQGGFENIIDSRLNRYLRLQFSMPRPVWANETDTEKKTTLNFQVTFLLALKNATAISDRGKQGSKVRAVAPVTCEAGKVQCNAITIPVVFGSVANASTFTLLAFDVPTLAYVHAIRHGAVQAVFQKAGYTIATIVLRYIFFVACVVQLIQLLYARYTIWTHLKKQKLKKLKEAKKSGPENLAEVSKELEKEHIGEFEQNWATLLNVMLILYMDPFFAVNVYVFPTPRFFVFLEFKTPLYFVVCVILSVLALCVATLETKPSYVMRISLVLVFVLILVLDLTDSGERGWHFNTVECVNFQCSPLRWVVLGLIITIIVVIAILLIYLNRNLSQLPYLATRPRQLSMRLIVFIFTSYVAYYIISTIVGLILFSHNDMLDQSHSELRIGTLCCAFAFVTIITTAFKFVLRTDRVPPHPSDQRWKRIVWPAKWHTWLQLHGGGAYMFFSESEEEDFDIVQSTKQDNLSDASDVSSSSDDDDHDHDDDDVTKPYKAPAGIVAGSGGGGAEHPYSDLASDVASYPNTGRSGMSRSDSDDTRSEGSLSARMFRRIESFTNISDDGMSNVLRRPQKIIDKMEDTFLGTANFFGLVSNFGTRPPFMNLETAIDAYNLAYEAYGVMVSRGDAKLKTGFTVTEAYDTVHHNARKIFNFCCCKKDNLDDDTHTHYAQFVESPPSGGGGGVSGRMSGSFATDISGPFSHGAGMPTSYQQNRHNINANKHSNNLDTAAAATDYSAGPFSSPQPARPIPESLKDSGGGDSGDRNSSLSSLPRDSQVSQAVAAATALADTPPINVEQYGFKQLFAYEAFDVQVVISEMDTQCERHKGKAPRYCIAFRGTNSQSNLIEDLRWNRSVWREMQKELSFVNSLLEAKVHTGFLRIWNHLQQAVLEKVAELVQAKPENWILVSGHSMGGAAACLCAYTIAVRFKSMFVPPTPEYASRMVQVYTFGMPKLGDTVFREEFNKKVPYTFRIVNESDTVSGIGVFMGHHVGTEVCIDRYGNFICNPMPVEKLFRPTQGKGIGFKHHSMHGYKISINKIAEHTSLGHCPSRCLKPYVPELATKIPSSPQLPATKQNLSGSSAGGGGGGPGGSSSREASSEPAGERARSSSPVEQIVAPPPSSTPEA